MKKLFWLGFFAVIIWLLIASNRVLLKLSPSRLPLPSVSPSPSTAVNNSGRVMGLVENEQDLHDVELNGKRYRFSWVTGKPDAVSVGINTNLEASSSGIRAQDECRILINGGFYDTNTRPIGLLVNQGEELSPWQENKLLNGVIGWNRNLDRIEVLHNNEQAYTALAEDEKMWWGVQSGPILWLGGKPLALNMARDEEARRMVGGVTANNELFLAVVVGQDSLFGGPKLVELPPILAQIQELIGVKLEAAINLDGGTASAFLTSGVQLKELKPIGSFLCLE